MKFFHLSDLHIGLRLMNRDMREDHTYILEQIIRRAAEEKPDAVVIAGDIYDKAVPSAEAVEVFDAFISGLSEAVPEAALMLISGNHDSGPRINCYSRVLARQNLFIEGTPPQTEREHIRKVALHDAYGPVNFYLLPFVRPSMVRQILQSPADSAHEGEQPLSYDAALHGLIGRETIRDDERNVLVSHQFYLPPGRKAGEVERMDSEIRFVGNVDEVRADVLAPFDYAALGHIHKPMKVGSENYRYCGTPLACSVSEAGQEKSLLVVEMARKGEVSVREIPLVPLRQIRVLRGTPDEILPQACRDYVRIILTGEAQDGAEELQGRIRAAFPYLLEILRENERTADYFAEDAKRDQAALDPFEVCSTFLRIESEEERRILRDVLNTVAGEGNRR